MSTSIANLANELKNMGLVASVRGKSDSEKIVGGTKYDDSEGIGFYERKYEVLFED